LNLEQSSRYPNFDFKLIFPSISNHEGFGFSNFAIWEDIESKYKVLFDMNYGYPDLHKPDTTLTFANFKDDENHANPIKIQGAETMFDSYMKRAENESKKISKLTGFKGEDKSSYSKVLSNELNGYLDIFEKLEIEIEYYLSSINRKPTAGHS